MRDCEAGSGKRTPCSSHKTRPFGVWVSSSKSIDFVVITVILGLAPFWHHSSNRFVKPQCETWHLIATNFTKVSAELANIGELGERGTE